MIALLAGATLVLLPAEFPEPEGLERNVGFWERVYGEWSSAQVVFHDRDHMGVIYDVMDLGELRLHPRPADPIVRRLQAAARRELIGKRQGEIVEGLKVLARSSEGGGLGEEAVQSLEPKVRKLYRAIEKGGALVHLEGAPGRVRSQYGLADRFYDGLARHDRYRDIVLEALAARGLPGDLLVLAFVESLFDPTAVSHAGAAGMFQFMPATGREYGLTRGPLWDLRRDPVLAADAAARMLRRNYERLGSWPLALTGYNHGPNGVARGVRAVGSSDLMDLIERYSSPSWGFASRNFYAQFLAARRTLKRRYELFGDWVAHAPVEKAEVRLSAPIRLSALIGRACLPRETLVEYNPALLPAAFSSGTPLPRGYALRMPPSSVNHFVACAEGLSVVERADANLVAATGSYTVAPGDTLSAIARRLGVTVDDLIELNGLPPDGLIRAGQVLRVPER